MEAVKITIVEILNEERSIINCSYCNSKGRKQNYHTGGLYKNYASDACPICKGKGLLVVQHDGFLIKCARCEGTGHEPSYGDNYHYDRMCSVCEGSGALSLLGNVQIIT